MLSKIKKFLSNLFTAINSYRAVRIFKEEFLLCCAAIKNSFHKNNTLETVLVFTIFSLSSLFFWLCADHVIKSVVFLAIICCINRLSKVSRLSIKFFRMIEKVHSSNMLLSERIKARLHYNTHPLNKIIIDLYESLFKKNRWFLYKLLSASWRIAYVASIQCITAAAATLTSSIVATCVGFFSMLKKRSVRSRTAKKK